jgi:hypothetical protein
LKVSHIPFLSIPGFFDNAGLAEAHFPLSATRLPRVATAVAKIPDFQPVVAEQQVHLGGPREGGPQVSKKCSKTGAVPIHLIPLYTKTQLKYFCLFQN